MASTIGIKIANGEFYPLVEESSHAKKRLILTTVHDEQESVQIDLYKSSANTMADSIYIGSLVVENIKPRSMGEPSIEMIISSTEDGNINAESVDLDSGPEGEHQYLSVSLKSLDDIFTEYDMPDFELEAGGAPPIGLYDNAETGYHNKSSGSNVAAVVIAIIVVLLFLAAGIFYLFFGGKDLVDLGKFGSFLPGKNQPVLERDVPESSAVLPYEPGAPLPEIVTSDREQEAAAGVPEPVVENQEIQPEEQPVDQSGAEIPPALEPVAVQTPPPVVEAPKDGVPYRVRYGDTLWGISSAFYHNPWLYMNIARYNNIRNPDRIISGRTIRIPPRN